jgi:uncharacterized membrane protein YeaQ/YmgE (transglycosylase-associated protein family)
MGVTGVEMKYTDDESDQGVYCTMILCVMGDTVLQSLGKTLLIQHTSGTNLSNEKLLGSIYNALTVR